MTEKMAYSREFREKVWLIKEQDKLSVSKVAKRFGVGKASIVRGSNRIEAQLTRHKPTTKRDMEKWKQEVQRHPEADQYERAERFGVSQTGIGAALRRWGITRKKNILTSWRLTGSTVCLSRKNNGFQTRSPTHCWYWWQRFCSWHATSSWWCPGGKTLLGPKERACERSSPCHWCLTRVLFVNRHSSEWCYQCQDLLFLVSTRLVTPIIPTSSGLGHG